MFNQPSTKQEEKEIDPFCNDGQARNEYEGGNDNFLQRQSSIASFQNLSIDGSMSVCDSQFSHYNPSINEPFVSANADPEEKEMHAFLDNAGIFQVNIKAQLAEE